IKILPLCLHKSIQAACLIDVTDISQYNVCHILKSHDSKCLRHDLWRGWRLCHNPIVLIDLCPIAGDSESRATLLWPALWGSDNGTRGHQRRKMCDVEGFQQAEADDFGFLEAISPLPPPKKAPQ